jgi:hypothetical protein
VPAVAQAAPGVVVSDRVREEEACLRVSIGQNDKGLRSAAVRHRPGNLPALHGGARLSRNASRRVNAGEALVEQVGQLSHEQLQGEINFGIGSTVGGSVG